MVLPGGVEDAQFRAFNDTWYWDEAAVHRYQRIINAVANPLHAQIVGLNKVLGPSGMLGYLTYMAERLVQMKRLLKSSGSIFLHCDPTASHYLKLIMDAVFGQKNFRNEIIWGYGLGGSSKRWYSRKHDIIFFYSKGTNFKFIKPMMKATSAKMKGQMKGMTDTWMDIPSLNNMAKERTGYPTQKPLALLERIINASSCPDDVVLDPFCGCGTAAVAAKNLNRRFVGVDISAFAIDLIKEKRLGVNIPTKGIPTDMYSARKLAADSPFNFEAWAITRLPGFAPNTKQIGDGGVDGQGRLADKPDNWDSQLALAQVKGGNFNLTYLRDFLHLSKYAAIGCFITLRTVNSKNAKAAAAEMGKVHVKGSHYRRMNLWSIEDHFNGRPVKFPTMMDPYLGRPIEDDLFGGRSINYSI